MSLLLTILPLKAHADDYYMGRHGYDATRARQEDMDKFKRNMEALGAMSHENFLTLRLGLLGGLNYNEETPYGINGNGFLMARYGIQISGGFYGVWPMGDHSGIGIGMLLSQELGGGVYLDAFEAPPFIGNTSVDFILPIFFNERSFMELVMGLGIAYSDGNYKRKSPYIFNSPDSINDLKAGAAVSAKFGLNFGGYFSEHIGLAFGLIYQLFLDDFHIYGDYHYDTYIQEPDVSYFNRLHNFVPSINLLFR